MPPRLFPVRLWPKRLPAGNLALLDGHPGLGKTWVLLDLCARISAGRPFADGSPSPGPANCLIINPANTPALPAGHMVTVMPLDF